MAINIERSCSVSGISRLFFAGVVLLFLFLLLEEDELPFKLVEVDVEIVLLTTHVLVVCENCEHVAVGIPLPSWRITLGIG